jgi:hypothetical protein
MGFSDFVWAKKVGRGVVAVFVVASRCGLFHVEQFDFVGFRWFGECVFEAFEVGFSGLFVVLGGSILGKV